MSFDNSKKTISISGFANRIGKKPEIDLNDYTPGEVAFLASKICNIAPSSLPCRPEKTARIKAGMQVNAYDMMPVQIYRALQKASAVITKSDFNATGSVNGKDTVVVVSEAGQGHARVFNKPDVTQSSYASMFADLEKEIKAAEMDSLWTGGVRVVAGDSMVKVADKQIDSMMNSLVKYKPTGSIESNCLSGVKDLEPWKLENAAKAVVETIGNSENVPRDFVYAASQQHPVIRRSLRDKVAHTLGESLKNTLLTVPGVGQAAEWTRKSGSKPVPFNVQKPTQFIAKVTASVGEARIGLSSMSQVDGLPVAKETRKVMSMFDDVDIPSDVEVVKFVAGTKNECERLWRRYGYRENLLFMYPQDTEYSGAKFNEYFRHGQVRKGGVVAYSTENVVDLSKVKMMYLNLKLSNIEVSKKKELGEVSRSALEQLHERIARTTGATYVCIYANVLGMHSALWKGKKKGSDVVSKRPSVKITIPKMYRKGVALDAAEWYGYVSTRYASINVLVTNYLRRDLDPVPVERLPFVYANMLIFHHIHPVTRHIILTFKDYQVDGEPVYRLFREVRFYQLADGRKSELLSMNEFSLQSFFKDASDSFLPESYRRGVLNAKYVKHDSDTDEEEFETLVENDEATVAGPVAVRHDTMVDPAADAMASLLQSMQPKSISVLSNEC